MNHLGEKIKELRRARDMTQDELANCLGVTYQTVSKWETGVTSPDLSLIVPLARLFRVTTDELFCYSESANELKRAELQKRYDDTFKTGSMLAWSSLSLLTIILFAVVKLQIRASNKKGRGAIE